MNYRGIIYENNSYLITWSEFNDFFTRPSRANTRGDHVVQSPTFLDSFEKKKNLGKLYDCLKEIHAGISVCTSYSLYPTRGQFFVVKFGIETWYVTCFNSWVSSTHRLTGIDLQFNSISSCTLVEYIFLFLDRATRSALVFIVKS